MFCLTVGLSVLPAVRGAADDEPRPVPTYTNDDLRRVAPFRDQTGVTSEPATDEPADTPPRGRRRAGGSSERRSARGAERGEDYWRREAERTDDKTRRLEKQIGALQRKIEVRRRLPDVRPYTDPQLVDWRREIEELRAEIRIARERVEDRARREGAPPGWLR